MCLGGPKTLGSVTRSGTHPQSDDPGVAFIPLSNTPGTVTEYTTVSIPKDLAERVEETIEGTSFSSTSDLVRFLLRSIVIQHQKQGTLTEAEFDEITEQLRDLGYLQ